MTVIKLWKGFGPDREVQFTPGGDVFVLPPDLPADLYFEVQDLAERIGNGEEISEVDSLRVAYNQLLALCRYKRPELDRVPCTLRQLITGVAEIYSTAAEEQQEDAGPPPPNRSGGAAKSSRSGKTSRPRR